MALHFLNAKTLADDLANQRLSQKDKAYYMLAGLIFNVAVGYSTLTFSNAGRTWFGMYEFLLLVITIVYGFERCYAASNGDNNKSFILNFVCLSLPISVTTTLFVWASYWGWWQLYQHLIMAMSFELQEAVKFLVWINNELPRFTVLLAMVLSNGIFFLRMISHLRKLEPLSPPTR